MRGIIPYTAQIHALVDIFTSKSIKVSLVYYSLDIDVKVTVFQLWDVLSIIQVKGTDFHTHDITVQQSHQHLQPWNWSTFQDSQGLFYPLYPVLSSFSKETVLLLAWTTSNCASLITIHMRGCHIQGPPAVHLTMSIMLTESDNMSIKAQDWDKQWKCIQVHWLSLLSGSLNSCKVSEGHTLHLEHHFQSQRLKSDQCQTTPNPLQLTHTLKFCQLPQNFSHTLTKSWSSHHPVCRLLVMVLVSFHYDMKSSPKTVKETNSIFWAECYFTVALLSCATGWSKFRVNDGAFKLDPLVKLHLLEARSITPSALPITNPLPRHKHWQENISTSQPWLPQDVTWQITWSAAEHYLNKW